MLGYGTDFSRKDARMSLNNVITDGTLQGAKDRQQWGDQEIETLQQKVENYRTRIHNLLKLGPRNREEFELEDGLNDLDDQMRPPY